MWFKDFIYDIDSTSIGIREQDLDIIFDQFRQAHDDIWSEKEQGTGLGLPICKEIINHYGSNIRAESVIGQGSTFHFTLPATVQEQL